MVKAVIVSFCVLFSFTLYCCMIQGRREDEAMERLYREKWGTDVGKGED